MTKVSGCLDLLLCPAALDDAVTALLQKVYFFDHMCNLQTCIYRVLTSAHFGMASLVYG